MGGVLEQSLVRRQAGQGFDCLGGTARVVLAAELEQVQLATTVPRRASERGHRHSDGAIVRLT